jgi:hypothetical protein
LDKNKRLRAEDLWSASAAESIYIAGLINAAENRRKQAVKPSYAKRRQLKLTAEEAYKILGYLSAKVISKLKEGVDSVKVKEGTKALT